MQFHTDGFRPGDPQQQAASAYAHSVPSHVDVLIVGCGPAGLTLAAQLAQFPDIRTAIVEQKEGPLQLGQADGIACRTMEMFDAFGFSERVVKEACWINEVTFWKPDPADAARITRHGRVKDTEEGLSEFPHVVLNQARVHDFYLESMRNAPSRMHPFYGRRVLDVEVTTPDGDYPVTVTLERVDGAHAGHQETVHARYVVGCDGARSSVRKAIGRELVGDSANHAWGVMDVLAVSNFPDIRHKVAIQSDHGNVLIIPREGGFLTRFYVEMDKLGDAERVAQRGITAEQLIAAAQKVLHPYTLDVKEVAWWSVYEIGQRICPHYDDSRDGHAHPRVFIAGDACHTHSPKAGQGMNFSMQDTFNLGWKLMEVLRQQAHPSLLRTYSSERQVVAQQLIDFDREWAAMFSERGGVDPKEFQKYFEQHARFTAGLGTQYAPSAICAASEHQALATGYPIGMRMHSAPVVRVCDAKPMHLGHVAQADGRWRLYAFAGAQDQHTHATGLHALCEFLANHPDSPILKYTPRDWNVDAIFDLRAIFQEASQAVAIEHLPALLRPQKGKYQLYDLEKVFAANHSSGDDIFAMRGIDRAHGALVVVRPDQYVAHVLPLDAHLELAQFFDGFMQRVDR
jgi:3-hydroxybenzoate 4-monooxygenase